MPVERDAVMLLAGLVLEDDRTWGESARSFQLQDALAVLDPQPGDPRWHFVVRPRGASKTTDMGGCALALLVTEAPPRSRSFCYASDKDQAAELLDAIGGFVGRTSGLAGVVRLEASRVVVPATGATLSIEAADAASAFGHRPWAIFCDELSQWPDLPNYRRLWAAITSSLPKVKDSRLVVITTAGSPTSFAFEVWQRAQRSRDWHTSHLPGPCPWWSPAHVEALRSELTPAQFGQLVECQWVESDEVLASAEDVLACVGHQALEPEPRVRYCLALDVGTRLDLTALVVTHSASVGGVRKTVVDRVLWWRPRLGHHVELAEVQTAVVRLSKAYNNAPLVFDRSQAEQLVQEVKRQGVQAKEFVFSTANVNRLAKALFVALRDRALVLPDDPELISELQTTRLVETGPGTIKLQNPRGSHDDVATAIGMAVVHLTDHPTNLTGRFDLAAVRQMTTLRNLGSSW
jgi:phage terminase large subunit-like protein